MPYSAPSLAKTSWESQLQEQSSSLPAVLGKNTVSFSVGIVHVQYDPP